jgi:hypothetical protein
MNISKPEHLSIEEMLALRIEKDLLQIFTGNTNTVPAAADNDLTVDKLKAAMRDLPRPDTAATD